MKLILIAVLIAAVIAGVMVYGPRRAEAATPPKPLAAPLPDADFQRFLDWRETNALPAINLAPSGPAPREAGGNRYGGPVWLAAGEAWPTGRDGQPLSFLAQIDFSRLPPLEDYPTSGVLQFFIGRDDLYGADFDHPERGDFRVIWRETLDGPGALHDSRPLGQGGIDDYSPLHDKTVAAGIALTGHPDRHLPDVTHWTFDRDLKGLLDRDPTNRIYDYIDAEREQKADTHHVGGHPGFTQGDYRGIDHYQDVDRVLLQLWSDNDTIMWGDSGQGQFTIRRADLLKRDFSKVLYQWDCY